MGGFQDYTQNKVTCDGQDIHGQKNGLFPAQHVVIFEARTDILLLPSFVTKKDFHKRKDPVQTGPNFFLLLPPFLPPSCHSRTMRHFFFHSHPTFAPSPSLSSPPNPMSGLSRLSAPTSSSLLSLSPVCRTKPILGDKRFRYRSIVHSSL